MNRVASSMYVILCVGASVLHTCLVCSFRVLLISCLVKNICVVVCVRDICFFFFFLY